MGRNTFYITVFPIGDNGRIGIVDSLVCRAIIDMEASQTSCCTVVCMVGTVVHACSVEVGCIGCLCHEVPCEIEIATAIITIAP